MAADGHYFPGRPQFITALASAYAKFAMAKMLKFLPRYISTLATFRSVSLTEIVPRST